MGASSKGMRRPIVWQTALLALGLLVFGGLVYEAGPRVVLRILQRLGWLTPLLAVPYLTSYVVDAIGWW
jgi:hypothetical protein